MRAFLNNCTAEQKRVLFLALTFVLVVALVLMCPDAATALLVIGGLLAFCAAFTAAGRERDKGSEGFFPLPGAPAPYAVASTTASPPDAGPYPGAIDLDEYDTEAQYGHRDRTEGDGDYAPAGNPYNRGRISWPAAADACVDDEANDAEMDGDELMTYHGRARNDAERVTAGTMNRRRDMDKYFREEVEIAEQREWWGRHEE